MSVHQARFWLAVVCLAVAYVLPLVLWIKRRPAFPAELLVVPALVVTSWWIADALELRPPVGFTFYGALPAAVSSNLLVLILMRVQKLRSRRILWNVLLVGGAMALGVALQCLLPPISD